MNILLAVDGSKNSLDAVSSLIAHANWFREPPTVRLLTVHLPLPRIGAFGAGPSKKAIDAYYREEGGQCLAKAKKLLDKAKIPHEDMILVGPVYWHWSLVSFLLAVLFTSLIGRLTRYYFGKKIIELLDFLMLRVPLLNKIYGTVKQVNEAFSPSKHS